jgi:hypothetical protein
LPIRGADEALLDRIVIDHESHKCGFGSALLVHCNSEMFERQPIVARASRWPCRRAGGSSRTMVTDSNDE